jgi:Domain of unknown function (DUF4410)
MALASRIIFSITMALLVAGCAGPGSFGSLGGGSAARPRTIAVSDFVFGDGVVGVDRGFTARLERKIGAFPTFERKQRTNERVNDEIVASIVASLREAGLEAQPGNEDTLQLKDDSVVVSGALRAVDPAAAKKNQVGFGSGRAGVIAEMSVTRSKRQLLAFAAGGEKRPSGPAGGKAAASREAAIAASLVASNAAKERLSPDVEAQARGLGRAIAEKILGYAKEQGWLEKPAGAETAATEPVAAPAPATGAKPAAAPGAKPAQPEPEQRVRLPDPKPEPKSAQRKTGKKPAADPDADPDAPDPDAKN